MNLISVIISAIALVASAVVFLSSKIYKMGEYVNRLISLEEKCRKFEDEYGIGIRRLNEDMVRVRTILIMKHKGIDEVFSEKHSPRILNSLGMKMFSEMHGEEFLCNNKDFLFRKLEETEHGTAYDVEASARIACYTSSNDERFNPIKDFVYHCPLIENAKGEKIEFTLDSACFVLSLGLRDLYLKEHPEIKQ